MSIVSLILPLFALAAWIIIVHLVLQARHHLLFLKDIEPLALSACPPLSVIVPARNEERNLEDALQSLLRQDYPAIEFIVINDRSTDATGAILERLAQQDSRLRLLTISSLPHGWLGKNYALHRGAQVANGAYLLFTDADVVMHPLTLRKAMQHMIAHDLDYVTIAPEITMRRAWLQVIAAMFGFSLLILFQPWKMRDPKSPCHIGIGAFTLVRTEAYRVLGGHKPIALRPDDDLKLSKLFKRHGYRQDLLLGQGMIFVEWYASLREMIEGLSKNTFAGVDYRISLVVLGTLLAFAIHLWPWVGLAVTTGLVQFLYGLVVLIIGIVMARLLASQGIPPLYALGFPAAILLLLYIQWKAMLSTLWSGGITWRGTHYPLKALKANKL